MNYLLIAYLSLYLLLIFLGFLSIFISDETLKKEGPLEHFLDLSASLLLLAGMIFLLFELGSPSLRLAWILPATLAAGYILWSSWRDRQKITAGPKTLGEKKWITFADVGTLVLVLPAYFFNLTYALRN